MPQCGLGPGLAAQLEQELGQEYELELGECKCSLAQEQEQPSLAGVLPQGRSCSPTGGTHRRGRRPRGRRRQRGISAIEAKQRINKGFQSMIGGRAKPTNHFGEDVTWTVSAASMGWTGYQGGIYTKPS